MRAAPEPPVRNLVDLVDRASHLSEPSQNVDLSL